jgi:5'-nucleotidase
MNRPHVLITNDDGIDSFFLRELIESHLPHFRVSVAAPLGEQSWIGRAFSRLRDVQVARVEVEGCAAWSVDGTPSDCVNIALGHLLPQKPDVVISGINIGYNVSMPLSLSSGTLAGAIEGAAWGLPALAFSLDLPEWDYEHARRNHGKISGAAQESLRQAALRAADFTRAHLGETPDAVRVHNINFPRVCTAETPVEKTVPADARLGCIYKQETPTAFRFHWAHKETDEAENSDSDIACLRRGHISHSVLNYSTLGERF